MQGPLKDQIAKIQGAVDNVVAAAAHVESQNKTIDELTAFMEKHRGNEKSTSDALTGLQDQVRKMKQSALGDSAQLDKLAVNIAGALKNMTNAEAQKNRLGIRMATISFSFNRDSNGNRIEMPYKNPKDYLPDNKAMAFVLHTIHKQVDAITRPGYAKELIDELIDTQKPTEKFIA